MLSMVLVLCDGTPCKNHEFASKIMSLKLYMDTCSVQPHRKHVEFLDQRKLKLRHVGMVGGRKMRCHEAATVFSHGGAALNWIALPLQVS